MIKISVVIPTYNNKRLLNNALESLNDQLGFENGGYEVIVVDEGSDDNTRNEIRETPRTYPFQYHYLERTENSCRSRVRNIGWSKARGEYVAFLDSDMIVSRSYIRELERCFETQPDMLVVSYRFMLKEPVALADVRSGRIFERNYRKLDYLEVRHFDSQLYSFNLPTLKHPWHCVYSCNMALPKARLEQLGGFEESYKGWGMEDTDIGYRCYRLGMSIVYSPGMDALHQYHGEAFGDLKSQNKMREWDLNIKQMYKLYPQLRREFPRWRLNFAYATRRVAPMLMRRERNRNVRCLALRKEEELPFLKAQIAELSAQPGNLIIVRDEVESLDFHLWVQLLGHTRSEIRYFPSSYVFDPQEIKRFLGQVFSWKKLGVLAYRGMLLVGSRFIGSFRQTNRGISKSSSLRNIDKEGPS